MIGAVPPVVVVEHLVRHGLPFIAHTEHRLHARALTGDGTHVERLDGHALGKEVELRLGAGRSPAGHCGSRRANGDGVALGAARVPQDSRIAAHRGAREVPLVMETNVLLEACVDSLDSALAAERGGAARVELCANLVEGGTTPSLGVISETCAQLAIPAFVIVRPRGGDFAYDAGALRVMWRDIIAARGAGADGVVFGALTPEGAVDVEACRLLLDAAEGIPCTFHRAFDMTRDLDESLDALGELGMARVLTSGGAPTALEGAERIASLVRRAGNGLQVMAGGGVRVSHVRDLVQRTGVREVHARLVRIEESGMRYRRPPLGIARAFTPDEYRWMATDEAAVAELVAELRASA